LVAFPLPKCSSRSSFHGGEQNTDERLAATVIGFSAQSFTRGVPLTRLGRSIRDPVFESKGIYCCGLEPGALDRTNRCKVEHNGCQAQPGRFDHNRIGTDVRRELSQASSNGSTMILNSSGENAALAMSWRAIMTTPTP